MESSRRHGRYEGAGCKGKAGAFSIKGGDRESLRKRWRQSFRNRNAGGGGGNLQRGGLEEDTGLVKAKTLRM